MPVATTGSTCANAAGSQTDTFNMVGLNMSHRLITLATCNLDQWAMDFEGNLKRVMESIRIAKEKGATYRVSQRMLLCSLLKQDTPTTN